MNEIINRYLIKQLLLEISKYQYTELEKRIISKLLKKIKSKNE